MNLEKDLHPISHYIGDREEMLNQVFRVIRGAKLRAMLTSVLKDFDVGEIKELCLEQLEGMSKKRIKCILSGQAMDESSATEDDDDDEDGDDAGPDNEEDIQNLFKDFKSNEDKS